MNIEFEESVINMYTNPDPDRRVTSMAVIGKFKGVSAKTVKEILIRNGIAIKKIGWKFKEFQRREIDEKGR